MSGLNISSFSFSLSYADFSTTKSTAVDNQAPAVSSANSTQSTPATTDGEHHHGHFMQALKITLIQIGINISGQNDTTSPPDQNNASTTGATQNNTTTTPADTTNTATITDSSGTNNPATNTNDITQALHAFMYAMFQAMGNAISGPGREGRGEHEEDQDEDDGGKTSSAQQNGYSSSSTQVDALLQSVKTDNTTPAGTTGTTTAIDPAATAGTPTNAVTTPASSSTTPANPLDELKKAFAGLLEAMNAPNSNTTAPVTLQSFLESLVNNLSSLQSNHQSLSMTGMIVDITM